MSARLAILSLFADRRFFSSSSAATRRTDEVWSPAINSMRVFAGYCAIFSNSSSVMGARFSPMGTGTQAGMEVPA